MSKFLLVYTGGDQPTPEDDFEAITKKWIAWFSALGDAVVDPGHPLGASSAVGPGGSVAEVTSGVGGYTIVTAESLEAAIEIAKGSPHLDANGTVEVYETIDIG